MRGVALPAVITAVLVTAWLDIPIAANRQARAPTQPTPSVGAISGAITDAIDGRPVAGAVVSLQAVGERAVDARRQFSDAKGRFVFLDVRANVQYLVRASKDGYFDGAYGRREVRNWDSTPIPLLAGQWLNDVRVELWRLAAIKGRVLDERASPVAGVFVRVLARQWIANQWRLVTGPTATTDDRGEYHIGSLPPGRYLVMVPSCNSPDCESPPAADGTIRSLGVGGQYPVQPASAAGRALTYPITFANRAHVASEGLETTLIPGAEQGDVDVELSPVPAVRVSGFLRGPNDEIAGRLLRLLPSGLEDLGLGAEMAMVRTGADGSFTFFQVPLGEYVLECPLAINGYRFLGSDSEFMYGPVLPMPGGVRSAGGYQVAAAAPGTILQTHRLTGRSWARVPILVTPDGIETVEVRVNATATISGTVLLEQASGGANPSRPAGSLVLEPAEGEAWLGRTTAASSSGQWEFKIDGLVSGSYVFRFSSTTWLVKSVHVDGRDYSDRPLTVAPGEAIRGVRVTLTDAAPTLSGTVYDVETGRPIRAMVIVFPLQQDQWSGYGITPRRIAALHTSDTGAYEFRTLPAGDYYVVALREGQRSSWFEPGFLAAASSRATPVRLSWGERTTQVLRLNR